MDDRRAVCLACASASDHFNAEALEPPSAPQRNHQIKRARDAFTYNAGAKDPSVVTTKIRSEARGRRTITRRRGGEGQSQGNWSEHALGAGRPCAQERKRHTAVLQEQAVRLCVSPADGAGAVVRGRAAKDAFKMYQGAVRLKGLVLNAFQ